MHRITALLALAATAFSQTTPPDPDANAPAASPAQNRQPKQLPPPGVAIPDTDRAELSAAVAELGRELAPLVKDPLYADVAVFHKAVDWALRYNEFYNVKEVATARELLKEGRARAAALRKGAAPWTSQTGLVVRGYRSRIDGSVQPFGMVVPATWKGAADKAPRATWIWNHGRGETLSELAFIAQRMKSAGEFVPADTFVVHPYGRYCNATKFAGEVDVFEALDSARKTYPVDNSRLVNAGFSMGGASAWHLAVHHSGLWAASHAGAGFAETAEYAGVFAPGKTPPPWWEVILYRWYDATASAANLTNHPMFAYYGEQDKQKQATQIMKRFAEKEGVKIEEFEGPGVGHKYEAGVKRELLSRIEASLKSSPSPSLQKRVKLTAYTLRGLSRDWLRVHRLQRTWERADVDAILDGPSLTVTTRNSEAISFSGSNDTAAALVAVKTIVIDGAKFENVHWDSHSVKATGKDWTVQSTQLAFEKVNGAWRKSDTIKALFKLAVVGTPRSRPVLEKTAHLCGPIDHAFMDSFLFVKPTNSPLTPALGEWTSLELAHATKQWRGIFRGDAPAVNDADLTDVHIRDSNLVLWGDPSSNSVLKRIIDNLPLKWTADGVEFGGKKYAANHVPVLIFPNPLNPTRYVVLNSGFTFSRPASSGTNSQQTPKLPDWAIVDISVPPDDKFPGKIEDAGFFDEKWSFTTERPK